MTSLRDRGNETSDRDGRTHNANRRQLSGGTGKSGPRTRARTEHQYPKQAAAEAAGAAAGSEAPEDGLKMEPECWRRRDQGRQASFRGEREHPAEPANERGEESGDGGTLNTKKEGGET